MSKHTKGPWSIYDVDCEYPGIESDKEKVSIIIFGERDQDCGVRGRTRKEILANARLIAAAPELIDACKKAIIFIGDGRTPSDCMSAKTILGLAIAKAEGEQQ